MTIEDLEELRYLDSEIMSLQQKIEDLHKPYKSPAFEKIGSSPLSPGDPTAQAAYKATQLECECNEMIKELRDKQRLALTWVKKLDNHEICAIIICHYIDGKNWNETSREVYGKSSYYNARKTLMRFFGKEK